ncbi:MAG TPA: hypothetical protein VMT76_11635 [Puia sp.]|nr:hypothetical protein [Puia sp.]
MHENEFEKQVREKMEELNFIPSDAVWESVDKKINNEKKRRRPIFWLFLFVGLMTAGAGYYFISGKKNSLLAINDRLQRQIKDDKKNAHNLYQSEKTGEYKKGILENNQYEMEMEKAKNAGIGSNLPQQIRKKESVVDDNKSDGMYGTETGQQKKSAVKAGNKIQSTIENKKADDNVNKLLLNGNQEGQDVLPHIVKGEGNISKKPDHKTGNVINKDLPVDAAIKTDSAIKKKQIPVQDNIPKNDSTDKQRPLTKNMQKIHSSWAIGYTAMAGISNMSERLFQPGSYANGAYYSSNVAIPSPLTHLPSKINMGFSWGAGIFMNKKLSKKFSWNAGLHYQYYSTHINIGNYVDSVRYIYQLSSNAGGAYQAARVAGYYNDSSYNNFTNKYHFVELPLSLSFILNKNLKKPLAWDAALSFSYLVRSNVLQFDPISGVYYKNDAMINKMQANISTGFMLGIYTRNNELQLGPQIQYGLTSILKKSAGNPQHLFFAGLKVLYIPHKK